MPRLKLLSSPLVKDGFSPVSKSTTSHNLEQKQGKPHLNALESFGGSGPLEEDALPNFVRHEESTNIELFYDLFFVANLTTFSIVHEVNSKKTLTSYVGFFCVLWFTWCQTSLFDVRFIADSFLERVAKALHLGVMVGLAVVGPKFDTADPNDIEDGESAVTADARTLQTMGMSSWA
jgi:hypothetical protein